MRSLRPPTSEVRLRKWQHQALRRLDRLTGKDAMVVATPGSGKTTLALADARRRLDEGSVERVVVVCPTDHLRRQWAGAAASFGIDLDSSWSNADGIEASDFHGVVVTYQQVSYAPDLYRMNCQRRTLVVFDEVHHAGDSLDWGNKLKVAFEPAVFRLALSGTPFRSDNNPIPFVSYEQGRSRADFEYSYGRALADNVCRPVYFPSYEGRIQWLSSDGKEKDHSLLDPLARARAAERLRAALCPRGDWLREVITEANNKLSEFRAEGHANAAGLVIAIDQEHAKQIALLLHRITGTAPMIAISEDPDASEKIRRFAANGARWIVAVRMISEGVDIPRLRVGVYATNVQSELFFRQAVGRFVRVIHGLDEQSASVYIPADEALVGFARHIKEERDHQLLQLADAETDVNRVGNTSGESNASSIFAPLSSDAREHDTIFDGRSFDLRDLHHAESVKREMGVQLPTTQVAALLRRGAEAAGGIVLRPSLSEGDEPANAYSPFKAERKQQLRRNVQHLAGKLARRLNIEPREVHRQWIANSGRGHQKATESDLQRKRDWLVQQLSSSCGKIRRNDDRPATA